MTCRAPLEAARRKGSKDKPIVYKRGRRPKTLAEAYEALELPCGQCASCLLEYSRTWAVRLAHEAAYWEEFHGRYSIFLTLTYDDDHVPYGGQLVKSHAVDFLKRLRYHANEDCQNVFGDDAPLVQFRYYMIGEYGSQCPDHGVIDCPCCGPVQRPHYHAVIFGWTPPDKEMVGVRDGESVYTSKLIEKAWSKDKVPIGFHEFGSVTFESCAYVTRYIMKKQKGDNAKVLSHYTRYIPQLDTLIELPKEFAIMSRGTRKGELNGGLGRQWYEKFKGDLYPTDETPIPGRGIIGKPPKFYDALYEQEDPEGMAEIKSKRRDAMADSLLNGPSLESRAKVEDARMALYQRKL